MIFIIAFLGAITPGPDILLVLRVALRNGFLESFKTLLGIASGWIIYLALLYFGLSAFLKGDIMQILLGVGGGIYLLYLSYLLFRVKLNDIDLHSSKKMGGYLKGLIINLSNPKAIIFFSIIIAPYMDRNPLFNLALLFAGLVSAFLLVIVLASKFRFLITNKLFYIIDKLCSIAFFGFGVGLIIMAFKKLGVIE